MIGDCDRGPYTRSDANCDMIPTPERMLIVIGVLTLEGMLIAIWGPYTRRDSDSDRGPTLEGILIVIGSLHSKGC